MRFSKTPPGQSCCIRQAVPSESRGRAPLPHGARGPRGRGAEPSAACPPAARLPEAQPRAEAARGARTRQRQRRAEVGAQTPVLPHGRGGGTMARRHGAAPQRGEGPAATAPRSSSGTAGDRDAAETPTRCRRGLGVGTGVRGGAGAAALARAYPERRSRRTPRCPAAGAARPAPSCSSPSPWGLRADPPRLAALHRGARRVGRRRGCSMRPLAPRKVNGGRGSAGAVSAAAASSPRSLSPSLPPSRPGTAPVPPSAGPRGPAAPRAARPRPPAAALRRSPAVPGVPPLSSALGVLSLAGATSFPVTPFGGLPNPLSPRTSSSSPPSSGAHHRLLPSVPPGRPAPPGAHRPSERWGCGTPLAPAT